MRVSRWGNITFNWGLWFIAEQLRFFICTLVGRVLVCVWVGPLVLSSFPFLFSLFQEPLRTTSWKFWRNPDTLSQANNYFSPVPFKNFDQEAWCCSVNAVLTLLYDTWIADVPGNSFYYKCSLSAWYGFICSLLNPPRVFKIRIDFSIAFLTSEFFWNCWVHRNK